MIIKEDSHDQKSGKNHDAMIAIMDFMKTAGIDPTNTYLELFRNKVGNDVERLAALNDPIAVEEAIEDSLRVVWERLVEDAGTNDWDDSEEFRRNLVATDPSDPTSFSRLAKMFLVNLMSYVDGSRKLSYAVRRAISMAVPILEEYSSGRINKAI